MRCLSIFSYNSMGRCTLCMYMADTWIKFLRTPETYLSTCPTNLPRCTRRTEKLSTNDASSARCAAAGCNNINRQKNKFVSNSREILFSKLLVDSNQLTAKGLHKHEGYNFCDRCHEQLYDPRVLHLDKMPFMIETRSHMQEKLKSPLIKSLSLYSPELRSQARI